MIETLRTRRGEGFPIQLCAEEIGVCYPTAVYKCRELKLAGRLNRGRKTGQAVLAEGATDAREPNSASRL
jgi:hypothetical protein